MGENIFQKLSTTYPFITLCKHAGVEYVGIIQNRDDSITTIYDFGSLNDPAAKKLFIELAHVWWWESNRSIPINIFLKTEWNPFKDILKTFSNKDLEIIHGPVCSLSDIGKKKTKRRSITLIKKL